MALPELRKSLKQLAGEEAEQVAVDRTLVNLSDGGHETSVLNNAGNEGIGGWS